VTQRPAFGRYPPGIRWPTVMAASLGTGWHLVEEGLPGRTAQFHDPVMDGIMHGFLPLRQALQSHTPLDVLTIMLGTNDVKARFGATPETVMGGIAGLLDLALGDEMQLRHGGFKVLLIAPPPVVLQGGMLDAEFWGAPAKSAALPPLLADLADAKGAGFLNAGDHVAVSPLDGVHLDQAAHVTLGKAVAQAVLTL
jgi:lysophospholipase L1-like esterase